MLKIIDNHCHFEQLTDQEQQQALNDYCVIAVASDYQSSLQLLALKQANPNLLLCLGIHPEQLDNYNELLNVTALIENYHHQLVGIGEIGLPYFSLLKRPDSEREMLFQQGLSLFENFVQLASRFNLPVNLHCVGERTWDAIACLERNGITRALFHWFAGDVELVRAIKQRGWFISVSPEVITNIEYQQQVKMMPKALLCLESDGPWLYQNKRGLPSMMLATAQKLALLFGCSSSDIIQTSQHNAQKIWRLSQQ